MESERIMIADAGGTKITWIIYSRDTKESRIIETAGVNAYFYTEDQIHDMIKDQLFSKLENKDIKSIYYYGAGCSDKNNCEKLSRAIGRLFQSASISINTDVLGSARALCDRQKGIACIIGTGSSACYYDGENITSSREGLGYALGDEGGGANIGKLILQQYIMNHFDEDLRSKFIAKFGELSRNQVLEHVYKKDAPNNYLGSFAVFASENRDHKIIAKLVRRSLQDFIDLSIVGLIEDKSVPINFIGSIACVFEDIVKDILQEYGYTPGKFIKNPVDGLIKYHS